MALKTQPLNSLRASVLTRSKWARRRDIPLAILAWIALIAVVLWAAAQVIRTLLILAIAALLAYALTPTVKFLQRFMPRLLAILVVYLLVLGVISLLLYLVVSTAIAQVVSLRHYVQDLLTPAVNGQPSPFEQTLNTLGISQGQIESARQQITTQLEGIAGSVIPLLRGIFNFILDTIIVAVLSIYLLIDGARVGQWLRRNAPLQLRERTGFLIDTIQRVVGGYIRGQLFLSTLIGLLVGVGMALFHVPYALLLGVLAFVFAFIPVLGTFLSGAICVLLALTQGWIIAVIVLFYFVGVHVFEGDIVGPRIVGKAVGLHPVISLVALVAGAELFGILGALFASPVSGVIQALIVSLWTEWRISHPEQFPAEDIAVIAVAAEDVTP